MNKVKFHLEERKSNLSENAPIILSYWFNGQHLKYYTGIQIQRTNFNVGYWKPDAVTKKVKHPIKATQSQAAFLNKKLEQIQNKIGTLHNNAEALEIELSIKYFRDALDKTFKGKGDTIIEKIEVQRAWEEYLTFMKANRAISTFKKHQTTRNHLMLFLGPRFKDLKFEDLTNKFVESFRVYLVSNGFQINTVAKYLNSLRDFLNWCKDDRRGYYNGKISYDVKEEDVQVFCLTKEELDQLEIAEMPNLTLDKARDMFVFASYTGMRYGDLYKLTKSDFKSDRVVYLIEKGKKTTNHTVPLVEVPLKIINKYASIDDDKLLPMFSNQKMNEYIKLAIKEAKINETVTVAKKMGNGQIVESKFEKWQIMKFHHGRKTFITIAVNNKMPENVLKSITGHSKDSRSFKKYYIISEELQMQELERVFSKSQ